jgi:creatinine amidohydrolase
MAGTSPRSPRLPLPIRTTSYFVLAADAFAAILEDQSGVLHACEAETSMMMALHPDLIDRARLAEAVGPMPESATSVLAQPMTRWRPFAEITETGVIGDARRASAEKGERLLEAAAEALAKAVV